MKKQLERKLFGWYATWLNDGFYAVKDIAHSKIRFSYRNDDSKKPKGLRNNKGFASIPCEWRFFLAIKIIYIYC